MNARQKEKFRDAWIANVHVDKLTDFALVRAGTSRPQPQHGLSCRELEDRKMVGVYATGENAKLLRIWPI